MADSRPRVLLEYGLLCCCSESIGTGSSAGPSSSGVPRPLCSTPTSTSPQCINWGEAKTAEMSLNMSQTATKNEPNATSQDYYLAALFRGQPPLPKANTR